MTAWRRDDAALRAGRLAHHLGRRGNQRSHVFDRFFPVRSALSVRSSVVLASVALALWAAVRFPDVGPTTVSAAVLVILSGAAAVRAIPSVLWPPNGALRLVMLVGASDPDGGTLNYIIVGNPTLGTLSAFDSATGSFTYKPNANANDTLGGPFGFTMQAATGNSGGDPTPGGYGY